MLQKKAIAWSEPRYHGLTLGYDMQSNLLYDPLDSDPACKITIVGTSRKRPLHVVLPYYIGRQWRVKTFLSLFLLTCWYDLWEKRQSLMQPDTVATDIQTTWNRFECLTWETIN